MCLELPTNRRVIALILAMEAKSVNSADFVFENVKIEDLDLLNKE